MRSAAAAAAINNQVQTFAEDIANRTAGMVGTDGKIKAPKKKKVLSPEEEADKMVATTSKKLLFLRQDLLCFLPIVRKPQP